MVSRKGIWPKVPSVSIITVTRAISLAMLWTSALSFKGETSSIFNQRGAVIKTLAYPQRRDFYDLFTTEINEAKNRGKRAVILAFPLGGEFVADFLLNLPGHPPGHVFSPLTVQTRFTFALPNITLFEKGRSMADKLSIYRSVENMIKSLGIDGRICVLMAICERAEYHIMTDGLLSEVLNILLSFSLPFGDVTYKEYEEAYQYGHSKGKCALHYKGCPLSIFNLVDIK